MRLIDTVLSNPVFFDSTVYMKDQLGNFVCVGKVIDIQIQHENVQIYDQSISANKTVRGHVLLHVEGNQECIDLFAGTYAPINMPKPEEQVPLTLEERNW